jgi:hypothetical protein
VGHSSSCGGRSEDEVVFEKFYPQEIHKLPVSSYMRVGEEEKAVDYPRGSTTPSNKHKKQYVKTKTRRS